jgi:nucleoside phosphorylase
MIAILCGLASEASAIRPALPPGVRIAVSGARPGRALALARELLAGGADAILSVGVAGALDPDLKPGDLLAPRAVVHGADRFGADAALVAALAGRCGARMASAVVGADVVAATPAQKAALRAATGASLVDMETHAVARAALEAAKPWAALRAIADDAQTALPAWTTRLIRENGRVNLAASALGALAHPADWPALLRLGRASATAHGALAAAGPGLTGFAAEQPTTPA